MPAHTLLRGLLFAFGPAHTLLRGLLFAFGATLLTLAPGCGAQYAQSTVVLGASSGGGAAFFEAAPSAADKPPAARAPDVAAPRDGAPVPTPSAAPKDARHNGNIAITLSSGDVIELAAPPTHGTIDIFGSGGAAPSLRYTPTPGYLGADQFSISLAGRRRTIAVSVTTGSP